LLKFLKNNDRIIDKKMTLRNSAIPLELGVMVTIPNWIPSFIVLQEEIVILDHARMFTTIKSINKQQKLKLSRKIVNARNFEPRTPKPEPPSKLFTDRCE
jgi:hypothetical protein